MKQYLDLLKHINDNGVEKKDRTGTGTISVFGHQMRFNLQDGFPLVTTKKLHLRSIIHELIWFINGETNIKYLKENGVTIWDEWADSNGDLGPIYGHQWRNWNGTDQLAKLMDTLKEDPNSRRMIVNSWNVDDLGDMGLPPCHFSFQIYHERGRVDLMWNQRSADLFLGLPYNIASYALLLRLIAHETNMLPGYIIGALGDVHLYQNHLGAAYKQLQLHAYEAPKLKIISSDILNGEFEYELLGYESNGAIKAKLNT